MLEWLIIRVPRLPYMAVWKCFNTVWQAPESTYGPYPQAKRPEGVYLGPLGAERSGKRPKPSVATKIAMFEISQAWGTNLDIVTCINSPTPLFLSFSPSQENFGKIPPPPSLSSSSSLLSFFRLIFFFPISFFYKLQPLATWRWS